MSAYTIEDKIRISEDQMPFDADWLDELTREWVADLKQETTINSHQKIEHLIGSKTSLPKTGNDFITYKLGPIN